MCQLEAGTFTEPGVDLFLHWKNTTSAFKELGNHHGSLLS